MTTEAISVLMVDDEQGILMSMQRLLRGERFKVTCLDSPIKALELLDEEFDVIISDMRMPEMDGAEFLSQIADYQPHTPRILLTGYSDHDSTVKAINDAKIFRFVSKPWDNETLMALIEEAATIKQQSQRSQKRTNVLSAQNKVLKNKTHELSEKVERSESELQQAVAFVDLAKEQLKHSYETFIKAFSNIINIKTGQTTNMNRKIQEQVSLICDVLSLDPSEKEAILNASQLYALGKVFLSEELLDLPFDSLSTQQKSQFHQHSVQGELALLPVQELSEAARIIRHQNELFNGSGFPDGLSAGAIPLGSRILKMVIDYNQFMQGMITGTQESPNTAQKYLKAGIDNRYDPAIAKAYFSILSDKQASLIFENEQFVTCSQLEPGMLVSRDLYNGDGMLLLSEGTKLERELILRIQNYERRNKMEILVPVNNRKLVS